MSMMSNDTMTYRFLYHVEPDILALQLDVVLQGLHQLAYGLNVLVVGKHILSCEM